jgi:hypothetical protein
MGLLNRAAGGTLGLLLAPFRSLPAWIALAFVSLLAAVFMLLVFRATSDQKRIARTKGLIQAAILEIRLFNEEPRLILAAQADVLRQSGRYIGLTLVPLLWMAVPLLLLLVQLETYYGRTGLGVGESAILKVSLADTALLRAPLALESDAGIEITTPRLAIPGLNEVDWRITAHAAGEHVLRLRTAAGTLTKTVLVSDRPGRRSVRRPGPGVLDPLLHPAEEPLPRGAGIAAIEIGYPDAGIRMFGRDVDWLIAFFAFTLLAALALRRPLRVTF